MLFSMSSLVSGTCRGGAEVGSAAFYQCSSLSNVSLGDGLSESIGDHAFQGCTSLASVHVPGSVRSVGLESFLPMLVAVECESWRWLGQHRRSLLQECTSLVSVHVPSRSVGEGAFYQCSSLVSVDVPGSVRSVSQGAFSQCSSLSSVSLGDGLSSIGNYAFRECTSLVSVDVPGSVRSVGEGAFYKCSSLSNVSLGDGLGSIGNYAFRECTSLVSVDVPGSVRSVRRSFLSMLLLANVSLPSNQSLRSQTRYSTDVSLLKSCRFLLLLHRSVAAFKHCSSLRSLVLPEAIKTVGGDAFFNCSSLENVIVNSPDASYGASIFADTFLGPRLCTSARLCRVQTVSRRIG